MRVGDRSDFRIGEIADLFGVTVQGVHLWIQTGKIRRFTRTSERGTYLIPRGEVARLLKGRDLEVPGVWTRPRTRILVIDDHEPIRKLAEHGFRRAGQLFEIRTSATLEDGLMLAAKFEPQLIVLDYFEGKGSLTSDQAIVFLRRTKVMKAVKVIGTSADASQRERMLRAGADASLAKPFTLRELQDAVLDHACRVSPS